MFKKYWSVLFLFLLAVSAFAKAQANFDAVNKQVDRVAQLRAIYQRFPEFDERDKCSEVEDFLLAMYEKNPKFTVNYCYTSLIHTDPGEFRTKDDYNAYGNATNISIETSEGNFQKSIYKVCPYNWAKHKYGSNDIKKKYQEDVANLPAKMREGMKDITGVDVPAGKDYVFNQNNKDEQLKPMRVFKMRQSWSVAMSDKSKLTAEEGDLLFVFPRRTKNPQAVLFQKAHWWQKGVYSQPINLKPDAKIFENKSVCGVLFSQYIDQLKADIPTDCHSWYY